MEVEVVNAVDANVTDMWYVAAHTSRQQRRLCLSSMWWIRPRRTRPPRTCQTGAKGLEKVGGAAVWKGKGKGTGEDVEGKGKRAYDAWHKYAPKCTEDVLARVVSRAARRNGKGSVP